VASSGQSSDPVQLRVALPAADPPDNPDNHAAFLTLTALVRSHAWTSMTFANSFRRDWLSNIRGDLLSGLVVALALIPEAIGFSLIAGVDPKVGLYASVIIAMVIAIAGGRPAMISAATAATAVLMGTLVREHGLQYLLAATVLAGVLQMLAGLARVGYVMRFVSHSVMTGFVNALAILIFMAQLPELTNVTWQTYVLVAAGLAVIYLFPRITKLVPRRSSAFSCSRRFRSSSTSTRAPWPTSARCRTRCQLC
jgi:SulP family sulfate permease